MKQDRLKEHETLRRMATADDGEALERRAREAEAAVALSGAEDDRLAALDRCAQLRVAIETARVGATREARRRRLEEKEEEDDDDDAADDDERVDLNTSMETEPGTGETWINS